MQRRGMEYLGWIRGFNLNYDWTQDCFFFFFRPWVNKELWVMVWIAFDGGIVSLVVMYVEFFPWAVIFSCFFFSKE